MKTEWLACNKTDRLILFFNGWGMDKCAVEHLRISSDLLMCYDYRTLYASDFPDLTAYKKIDVIAWSMGVWAAANVLTETGLKSEISVAICGTEKPVDDNYGIPTNIYELTQKGMDERGRKKFFSRMFVEKAEKERFASHTPKRELWEQLEELEAIHRLSTENQNTYHWDCAYVAENDIIFPTLNQEAYWQGMTEIIHLPGGHYPFYQFNTWEEIIHYGNR